MSDRTDSTGSSRGGGPTRRSPRRLVVPLAIAGASLLMSGWLIAEGMKVTAEGLARIAAAEASAATSSQPAATEPETAKATFAGGCFWCMEPPYDKLDGVQSTTSGYMGGEVENPSYEAVSAGGTGHAEVVQVTYDPDVVSYETLLEVFWRNIDPVTPNAQFCDSGSQYRSAIFAHGERQLALAEASKQTLERSDRFDEPIVTEVETASIFWPAEDYHQNYYQENPVRYKFYRTACGRDRRLEALWGSEAS